MSAINEDFDSEEHYISLLFITCDLWSFSFRWVCIRIVPCRFRDCHSDLCQIFFFSFTGNIINFHKITSGSKIPFMSPSCFKCHKFFKICRHISRSGNTVAEYISIAWWTNFSTLRHFYAIIQSLAALVIF